MGKTKAKKPRRVPISSVLKAVLDRRRNDPAGSRCRPEGYVFGDELGRRRTSVRMAWNRACARAKVTGLHFHDLRREGASRWMDAGVPLATIQRWLGHYNISQTSTYLAATGGGDADAMRVFEQAVGRIATPQPIQASAGETAGETASTAAPSATVQQLTRRRHQFYIVEMGKGNYLGAFEQMVLFALIRLGDEAYGMKIRREIVARTDRDVAIGAVYATLDRLEEKGFVSSTDASEGADDRGGNGRRFFRIEAPGISAVNESWQAIKSMTRGLKPLRGDA